MLLEFESYDWVKGFIMQIFMHEDTLKGLMANCSFRFVEWMERLLRQLMQHWVEDSLWL